MTDPGPTRLFNRDFTAYWLGIAVSAVGDALTFVAMPFLVLHLGGSGAALATVMLLASIPRFGGPILGALADRLPLRVPLLVGAAARTLLAAGVAALALHGSLPLWALYVAAPLNGLVTIFTFAAGNVVVPRLVPATRLAQANALMQSATMGAPMVGLGAGGALVAALGPAATLALAAPCLLTLAVAALVVRFPAGPGGERPSFLADLASGLRFMVGRPQLLVILAATLVLNASLNILNVLMPLAMERSPYGARGYGLFEGLISAGTLVGILAVTALVRRVPTRHLVTASQAVVAAGFAVLATGTLPRLLGGGLVIGAGLGLGEVASITLLQLIVPDGLRGKVLGLVLPANALGLTVGAVVAGAVATQPSYAPVLVGAAATVVALAVLWATVSRGLVGTATQAAGAA
ncbi:MAG: MFS transporter [Deinococcales bacterium]